MANTLFKKSYLYKTFKNVPYDSLWNSKGVFTTVRIKGKPFKMLFLKEHIRNLNQSLRVMNIKFVLTSSLLNKKFKNLFNNNIRYDHLFRIAVNNKKISFSLRKQKKISSSFKGILINYKRPNPLVKNLYYNKILGFLKSIRTTEYEIILTHNKKLLEGCTTNVVLVKNKKLYIPKNDYYFGITLQFISKYSKRKIFKRDIFIKELNLFDEILLVGSGKGIVQIKSIPQKKWKNKSSIIFNELHDLYNSYIKNYIAI